MKKSTKIVAVALVTLGLTTTVFAFGAHQGWRMSPEDKAEFITGKVTEKLDLSTTQQHNLESLATTLLGIMLDVRSNRAEHMVMLQELLEEPVLDQARVIEMIQRKTEMVNSRAPEVVASMAGFLDSLDPEQKKLLREHVTNHQHRHYQEH